MVFIGFLAHSTERGAYSVQLSYDPEMNADIIPKSAADLAYFLDLMPRSLSFMEMTRETPFSCCETP